MRRVKQRDGGDPSATSVEAAALTTDIHGYLIALVESGDEPAVGDAEAALEMVELRWDEGP